jgi:hypothetical protein
MGGSGGGGFFYGSSNPPEDIGKKIREQEERTRDDAYESKVADLIRGVLVSANDRDIDTIQGYLNSIKSIINLDIDGSIDLRYGGSVAKHTYVDGLSDIDCLAILNNSDLAIMTPDQVKDYFHSKLRKSLPKGVEITNGNLAITIKFASGTEIQILPAIKTETGIKIASSRRENEWSKVVRPDNFAKVLRYMNTQMSGKLVPVIKLAKSIISYLPDSRKVSGYHAESLAIETFARYTGIHKPKEMLRFFFSEGAKCVLSPVKDKTGQSVHVDDYLGDTNSIGRKMVSDSFSTIARKMQNADASRSTRFWEQILD